jgi:hypothetical protein
MGFASTLLNNYSRGTLESIAKEMAEYYFASFSNPNARILATPIATHDD